MLVAYQQALEEAKTKVKTDGYLTEVKAQKLLYTSEPNAVISVDPGTKTYSSSELAAESINWGLDTWGTNVFNNLNRRTDIAERVVLTEDQPVVVTYTDLENSYFNDQRISRVVYSYQLIESSKTEVLPVFLFKDPTNTLWYPDLGGSVLINMSAEFPEL